MRIHTVGHSTRTLEELVEVLRAAGVSAVADVRRFPASRRHPQFGRESFATGLAGHGLGYVWLGEALGGRREALLRPEESPNRAWLVTAFRNYADAMTTPEFLAGIAELEALAREMPTAFLCAERLWWQCHRRLISDFLLVRGWTVVHLLDRETASEHELTGWARVEGGVLTYPGGPEKTCLARDQ